MGVDEDFSFVLNKIKKAEKAGEDVEYWIATPPFSAEKDFMPPAIDELQVLQQLAELGAIAIQDPNGRPEKKRILDIGYEPPQPLDITVVYLQIVQPKFDEVYNTHKAV